MRINRGRAWYYAKCLHRARETAIVLMGETWGQQREQAIAATPSKLWNGSPLFRVVCRADFGKGQHEQWDSRLRAVALDRVGELPMPVPSLTPDLLQQLRQLSARWRTWARGGRSLRKSDITRRNSETLRRPASTASVDSRPAVPLGRV